VVLLNPYNLSLSLDIVTQGLALGSPVICHSVLKCIYQLSSI